MENIITKCTSVAEAVNKIYGYDNQSSRKKFFNFVTEKNIDITHLRKRKLTYERVVKQCPVCGNDFETSIHPKHEKTTCSYACSNTYFRSGKFNPNWKDDTYRSTCFEYHKKECIICGENKIVSVHHYDENRKNNSPENLIPLCPTHHQYVHSRYKDEVIHKVDKYREEFILEYSSIG